MQFLISSTFQDSLAKLQTGEQTAAKLAAIELQMNPSHPGLQMHKLDRARDRDFWSARVNDDLRLILHRTDASLLLCYVGHHDDAYAWAERRKLKVHPTTGAAQLVLLKETIQEILVPRYVEAEPAPRVPRPLPLLAAATDAELLGYGIPEEWLSAIRGATEDSILDLANDLPEEAREAVLNLATGIRPQAAPIVLPPAKITDAVATEAVAFAHPDAKRRFRAFADVEELKAALDAPWEKWSVFLHPAQQVIVERDFSGPARVTGSAGTGKTIVALHRAVYLAQSHPSSRVLLTTFSSVLVRSLENKLRVLIANRPRLGEQIEVLAFDELARRLYEANISPRQQRKALATEAVIRERVNEAISSCPTTQFSARFTLSEWSQVVDAAQLRTWEQYRDYNRLGRRSRLREPQREALWQVFARVWEILDQLKEMTPAEMFTLVAGHYAAGQPPPFDYAVVDEAQDISQAQLRCLASLGGSRPNALFFAGDTGQRIFQQPFSWKSLGVEVRGRSTNLKVNYRTSQEIREAADRLLGAEVTDGDSNIEDRRGTQSVFNGPVPEIKSFAFEADETAYIAGWIRGRMEEGLRPEECALFVRSAQQFHRAEAVATATGVPCHLMSKEMHVEPGCLPVSTMHLAKGLEFRTVAVMACDEDIIPDPDRVAAAGDTSELEQVYNSERQILYVACTRARDQLLVTGVGVLSEFVEDMRRARATI